jgi:WhiB family redox-sensing transcriptional regulator
MLELQPSDWREVAACRSADPKIFFPPTELHSGPARLVCATCPVQRACLEWALRVGESAGVWGGTTPSERRALSRRRTVPRPSFPADAA